MTTPPSLPTLPGLTWSRFKRPTFSTRIADHVSGREVRSPFRTYPLYEFEASYDGLTSSASAYPGLGVSSLQTLMGFFLELQGQYGTFLYSDPDDNAVTSQALGTGDGTTTTFAFVRTLGGFTEPASWVTSVSKVYANGLNQTSGWALSAPNSLVFTSAPAIGVAITADFSFAFECRFLDDQMNFEAFMSQLWQLQKMTFRSVKS
jgi:uncharacterized protein (TIGR02217 family)